MAAEPAQTLTDTGVALGGSVKVPPLMVPETQRKGRNTDRPRPGVPAGAQRVSGAGLGAKG